MNNHIDTYDVALNIARKLSANVDQTLRYCTDSAMFSFGRYHEGRVVVIPVYHTKDEAHVIVSVTPLTESTSFVYNERTGRDADYIGEQINKLIKQTNDTVTKMY